jgi:leucyl-tRNA synthetase
MDYTAIEKKWQEKWEKAKIFEIDIDNEKEKYYVLEMYPYPSGSGLHMGHAFNYTIGDVYARFKRMKGFNVLYPMGYDAFGLPAENAAIKAKTHPKKYTEDAMKNFMMQQRAIGISYDWSRMFATCYPDYYKWNQYFFLKFLENGLVYRKNSAVNWCPRCETVLANEQVKQGKCWRHEDTDVEMKQLEQWFIRITDYAEELLKFIPNLKWPERIKSMQENWIGKSYGTEIKFSINGEDWNIFTTRPDTIYGVTFMVVSAQHPRLNDLVTDNQRKEVEAFLKRMRSVSEKELEDMEKEGVFTGSYAINPMTKEKIPVYAGNFVIADYGSGMVMAVPAHDQRDFEFAKKYKIPIKIVIQPEGRSLELEKMPYTEEGRLVNSGEFNGIGSKDAVEKITSHLEKMGIGKKTFNYKLRDWLISRQRYWGTPIPIIYCKKCGMVPVPEKDLPVMLPENVEFGSGNPLASSNEFLNVECPKCKSPATRETDTMDTFVDSSWYYLRFCDSKNQNAPFEKCKVEYWMPVDQYIGGAEHACMHLIYARFFIKALRDMKYVSFDEPFERLFTQGMIHASDGNVMSKSLGNVVNPIEIIERFSADSLRLTLMSLASPDKDSRWSDKGMEGSLKFINKVASYFENLKIGTSSERTESKINKAIKDVTYDIENFSHNIAIIKIRRLFESISEEEEISKENIESFLKLLSVFCPHIAEELWEKLGNKPFISIERWPEVDESKINPAFEAADIFISNVISDVEAIKKLSKMKKPSKVTLFVAPYWKHEVYDAFLEGKEMKEIIKSYKGLEKEVADYYKRLMKKRPNEEIFLKSKDELCTLVNSKELLESEFECEVEIVKAEESKHPKATVADTGKPGILVE